MYVEFKRDDRMSYRDTDNLKPTRFHADQVKDIEIEDATELDRRMSLGRTGGVLLGPVGLIAGLGLGAFAKKQQGSEKSLLIELDDDRAIIAQVARKHVMKAHELRNQFRQNH